MGKFKVGQKVKCVRVPNHNFNHGKSYEIAYTEGGNFWVNSDGGCQYYFNSTDFNVFFEPVTPKFTAVSGDQSLFDLMSADDIDLYIIRSKSGKTLGAYHTVVDWEGVDVVAERKPRVEKYVPEVGDYFDMVTDKVSARMKCIYIDGHNDVWAHDIHGNVAKFNDSSNVTLVKVDK